MIFAGHEEQQVKDIVVKLVPLGLVSGHVLDEDGDPIPRANVTLLRYYYLAVRPSERQTEAKLFS